MTPPPRQVTLSLEGLDLLPLFGEADGNLRAIEQRYGVTLSARNGHLVISGPPAAVESAAAVVQSLIHRVRTGSSITTEDLEYLFSASSDEPAAGEGLGLEDGVVLAGDRRVVKVRSVAQARYVEAMLAQDLVFGIGPAGTGKTYLAVAVAVRMLREKIVERLILARPAVEAGERLGYLPGDLQEKVDPYLRPLYDALHEMVPFEKLQRFLQLGVIEVVPLAYMRGRTLSRSFVILDEAQNTTLSQMKMFLTRLGPGAKATVTGDITQIDLDDPEKSGLVRIRRILQGLEGIYFAYFTERDVVRHRLVKDIILAFDRSRETPAEEPER
jgi:phosphate starvation-inducible PhoH-like protein